MTEAAQAYANVERDCRWLLDNVCMESTQEGEILRQLSLCKLNRSLCLFRLGQFEDSHQCCIYVFRDGISTALIKVKASIRAGQCLCELAESSRKESEDRVLALRFQALQCSDEADQILCCASDIPFDKKRGYFLALKNLRRSVRDNLQPEALLTDWLQRRHRHWPRCADGRLLNCEEVTFDIMRKCDYIAHAFTFAKRWLQQMLQRHLQPLQSTLCLSRALYAAPAQTSDARLHVHVTAAARMRWRCSEVCRVIFCLATNLAVFEHAGVHRRKRCDSMSSRVYNGKCKQVQVRRGVSYKLCQACGCVQWHDATLQALAAKVMVLEKADEVRMLSRMVVCSAVTCFMCLVCSKRPTDGVLLIFHAESVDSLLTHNFTDAFTCVSHAVLS